MKKIVGIYVGGAYFETLETTILKSKTLTDAYQNSDEYLFVDRDPCLFAIVLNFLRNGELFISNDSVLIENLKLEARYFQLPSMEEKLDKIPEKMRFSNNWAYLSIMEEVKEAIISLKLSLQDVTAFQKDSKFDFRSQRRR